MNSWPIGFACGLAVSTAGTWLFQAPPAGQVTTTASGTSSQMSMAAVPAITEPPHVQQITAVTSTVEPAHPVAAPAVAIVVPPASISVAGNARGPVSNRDPRALTDNAPATRRRPQANTPDTMTVSAAPAIRFAGTLSVQSTPSGARVFVGGTMVGTTPVVVPELPAGSRVVRLEAEGYQVWSSAVRVIANQQTQVTATLYREPPRP